MAEACALLLGLAVERERFLRLAREAEETRTSEQMKSTLLAQLAHDLKTPVAAARGAVENWEADERRLRGRASWPARSSTRSAGAIDGADGPRPARLRDRPAAARARRLRRDRRGGRGALRRRARGPHALPRPAAARI